MVKWLLALTATTSSFALFTTEALACGCFAQTTPATPVVQAGEAVVFAHDGTNVEMHVQISYQGPAEEFAWLLPMPSVPEVQLSTIELFQMLRTATAPSVPRSHVAADAGDAVATRPAMAVAKARRTASERWRPEIRANMIIVLRSVIQR